MRPWRPWSERLLEIRQELALVAAGIGDLVFTAAENTDDDDDVSRCPECWWIWPDGAERCAGCGYSEPLTEC